MNKLTYILILTGLLLFGSLQAQVVPTPAPPQKEGIVITGATLHLGNGEVIENGTIIFENGKITSVGSEFNDNDQYRKIDASGKHVYPGFILPNTDIGLREIGAVRASVDASEIGSFNPEVRSIVAYNTDSHVIPTTRTNGILTAQVAPQGRNGAAGTSSIVQLDAWNWEDAAIKMDEGIMITWPSEMQGPRWWLGETNSRPNPNYKPTIEAYKKALLDGAAYAKETSPAPKNLKMESMKGLYDGSKTMYVSVNNAKAIMKSVSLLKAYGVKNVVVVGGSQAWYAKEFLKENKIPVILGNVHALPSMVGEDVDMPYKLPALLHKEGILVGLGYSGASSARNLPFFAGTASAYGMSREEALMCITSNTARILGMGDRLGSLEKGKDATLFISEGDALDMRTNKLTHAFIQGREIVLDDKHQMLYKRFKEKYERMD
ncbi:MAG: amidohydrolase family protein [Bacteroidia bacterium]|nr:amidohydrolase family protein [Bacteroidia bacterium]